MPLKKRLGGYWQILECKPLLINNYFISVFFQFIKSRVWYTFRIFPRRLFPLFRHHALEQYRNWSKVKLVLDSVHYVVQVFCTPVRFNSLHLFIEWSWSESELEFHYLASIFSLCFCISFSSSDMAKKILFNSPVSLLIRLGCYWLQCNVRLESRTNGGIICWFNRANFIYLSVCWDSMKPINHYEDTVSNGV